MSENGELIGFIPQFMAFSWGTMIITHHHPVDLGLSCFQIQKWRCFTQKYESMS
jgi:hypothetical protein